jgi:hypothetical protein
MKQNYRKRKLRKRPFLERKPENLEKIPVYFLSKNLLQKDDAPEQNGNIIASRINGIPTPFKKSNKNSGNAKHRRRNFLERKPENFEKVLPLFLENGNAEENIILRQNSGIRNDRSRTSSSKRGNGFNEIVRAFVSTNGQGVSGAGEAGGNEFNGAERAVAGTNRNGVNGFNSADGAAAGNNGNGINIPKQKRKGPRLEIDESGEGTISTNGGNEDQIESRVDFLSDTAKLRSSPGRPGRNVNQAGKIDGGDSEPARPKPKVAKKQKKRKSIKSIFTFGDEWSDSSDCNSDSSDCYGSDNGYLRTRPRKVNINIILTRQKFFQNRRRKFMPISATTEKNITKQNKQDVLSSDTWSWSGESLDDCDSSKSKCAYKYSSDSSDSSDSFEYRRQKIKTSVKSEANINNKRGGYFMTDSDSDSSEYRRNKNKPSVSFVDVKSETKMNNKRGGYFTTDSDSDSLDWIDDCDDSDSDSDCSHEYESDSSDYHNRFEKQSKQNGLDKIKQDESKPSIPRRIWSDSDSFEYYDWESSDSSDDFNIRNRLKTGVKEDNKNFKRKNYFQNDYSSEYFEYYSDSDSSEWDNSESYIYYDDK